MKVVSFGELLLRLTSPGFSRFFQKDSFDISFCGSEANVAVNLAQLNIPSSFVTFMPSNDIGIAARNILNYFHVNTDNVFFSGERLGTFYLEKGASQRPSKVIYDRKYSAFSLSKKTDYDWYKIFEGATWFHWSGITPALSVDMVGILIQACTIAKELDITISCDLNYRANLWDVNTARTAMKLLMPFVDVCIGNEEDVEKMLGIELANSNVSKGNIVNSDFITMSEQISDEYGCKFVASSLRKSISASRNGWRGMLFDSLNSRACFSKEYDIQIVDRVGSGDSFASGIIYGLINHFGGKKTIDFATALSCLNHSIEGDFNRITIDDVNALLQNGGNGRVLR